MLVYGLVYSCRRTEGPKHQKMGKTQNLREVGYFRGVELSFRVFLRFDRESASGWRERSRRVHSRRRTQLQRTFPAASLYLPHSTVHKAGAETGFRYEHQRESKTPPDKIREIVFVREAWCWIGSELFLGSFSGHVDVM